MPEPVGYVHSLFSDQDFFFFVQYNPNVFHFIFLGKVAHNYSIILGLHQQNSYPLQTYLSPDFIYFTFIIFNYYASNFLNFLLRENFEFYKYHKDLVYSHWKPFDLTRSQKIEVFQDLQTKSSSFCFTTNLEKLSTVYKYL